MTLAKTMIGVIAQLGERLPCTQEVRSSILLDSTITKPTDGKENGRGGVNHLLETHWLEDNSSIGFCFDLIKRNGKTVRESGKFKNFIELVLTNSSLTIWKSVTTIVVISNDQNCDVGYRKAKAKR